MAVYNTNKISLSKKQPRKAKIFLSCGQASDEEIKFAESLKRRLESKEFGFKVFVAITVSTITDLKREILKQLRISDYFLCVNFKRECVVNPEKMTSFYRGSLYTNQEIAMALAAGFHSHEMLILSEEGIATEGLLTDIIRNDCFFSERTELENLIIEKIHNKKWKPQYSRNLCVSQVKFNGDRPWPWTFRGVDCKEWIAVVEIKNRSNLTATNCMAHLKKIIDKKNKKIIPFNEFYPLKCCGFDSYVHTAWPGISMFFDILSVDFNKTEVYLHTRKDTSSSPIISTPGEYKLQYEVFADKFPLIRFNVDLVVGEIQK